MISTLVDAVNRGERITLLVGSGVSTPAVPGVTGLLQLADQFSTGRGDDGALSAALEQSRAALPPDAEPIDAYQAYRRVFAEWYSPRGFDVIAQQAVLSAYRAPDLADSPLATHGIWQRVDLRLGERLENSLDWWDLPPGVRALGRILAWRHGEFGDWLLTTNFDPLIEIAVRTAGRLAVSLPADLDGVIAEHHDDTAAVRIVHLHGYWRPTAASEVLLQQGATTVERPELVTHGHLLVVGHSGWDPSILAAVRTAGRVRGVRVHWALHEREPRPQLVDALGDLPVYYRGVDSDRFFNRLAERLQVPAGDRRTDPRRRVRHLDWERELLSHPGNTAPAETLPLLVQLERRFGWGVDWNGAPRVPRTLFWPIRLRPAASLINAVQAVTAAALSRRGTRVMICFDDFGVRERHAWSAAVAGDIRRWMHRVDPAADATVVSLQDFIDGGGPGNHPWSIARTFYGDGNPSLYSVLAAANVVPHLALRDLEQYAPAIVQSLLSRNTNRLLTPLVVWTMFQDVLRTEPAAEVLAYAGSDDRLMWEQFRAHFGSGGSLLYNPHLRNLGNRSRLVRWSTGADLRSYLSAASQLPGWAEEGRYLHWLVQNAFLLPRYLTGDGFAEVDGVRIDSWAAFAAGLDAGLPVLELLADDVSNFYLGG
ncbi:SIR2 family protein [Dactylosporangium sp. NPDC049742]|uniref:SIR2 family protein n=1 Tax=Dactylosporangium sp. NPDC049742 TaxID=3154737 RepID=UPI0034131DAA